MPRGTDNPPELVMGAINPITIGKFNIFLFGIGAQWKEKSLIRWAHGESENGTRPLPFKHISV